jgi:hypothetical protein
MKCDFDQELLTGYLDGELSPREQAEVESHLPACDPCRGELDELRELVGSVKNLPTIPVPDSLSEGIRAGLESSGAKVHSFPKKRGFRVEWAVSAAAVVFVAISVVYVGGIEKFSPPMELQTPATEEVVLENQRRNDRAFSMEKDKSADYGGAPLALENTPAGKNSQIRKSMGKSGKDQTLSESDDRIVTMRFGGRTVSPEFLMVQSSNILKVRKDLEKTLRSQKISFKPGAGSLAQSSYAKENCLLIELTQEELDALREKLKKGNDVLVMAGGIEEFRLRSLDGRKKPSPSLEEPGEDEDELALLGKSDKNRSRPEMDEFGGGTRGIQQEAPPKADYKELEGGKKAPQLTTGNQKEEKPESQEFKKFKGKSKSKGDSEREKESSRKIQVVIYFLEKE